jgi:hypothetical protein
MSVAYTIIRLILSIGVFSVAYMITSDINTVVMNIPSPLQSYAPSSYTDLINFTLALAKWIIVVFLLSLIWKSAIEAQRQDN